MNDKYQLLHKINLKNVFISHFIHSNRAQDFLALQQSVVQIIHTYWIFIIIQMASTIIRQHFVRVHHVPIRVSTRRRPEWIRCIKRKYWLEWPIGRWRGLRRVLIFIFFDRYDSRDKIAFEESLYYSELNKQHCHDSNDVNNTLMLKTEPHRPSSSESANDSIETDDCSGCGKMIQVRIHITDDNHRRSF